MSRPAAAEAKRIGFFLVPGFSMMALSAAMEPLRAANQATGRRLYSLQVLGLDPVPVRSGGDVLVVPDSGIEQAERMDLLVVVASLDVASYRNRTLMAWLRRLAGHGLQMGALSTATLLLARAGLLDGYRCTIHWAEQREFADEFPQIRLCRDLYCIDRDRYTCAGGVAAMDLMLALIEREHGRTLAADVAENFLLGRARESGEAQRLDRQWRYGVSERRVLDALRLMEEHLEDPLSTDQLAAAVGCSERQLERLFRGTLGKNPARFCLELRLRESERLLRQSALSLAEIAARCGFSSPSHFGKAYREHFGTTPASARKTPLSEM